MEILSVKNVKMAESGQKMVGTCDRISKASRILPWQESITASCVVPTISCHFPFTVNEIGREVCSEIRQCKIDFLTYFVQFGLVWFCVHLFCFVSFRKTQ